MADIFSVPGKKSSYHAKKHRNIGNVKLKKQKYFEALENLNKSLCLAETGSQDISLAYASRTRVYKEVKEIEKCMINTQLEMDSGRIQCEERFHESTRGNNVDGSDEPWSFFKLSYPANPKIPFVTDCLELQNDDNFGRYITAKHCLKPGDIIAIEEPFFKIVESSASHLRCANCLKSNKMNLLPSSLSSSSKSSSHYQPFKMFHGCSF